jgi:hypothetical protein
MPIRYPRVLWRDESPFDAYICGIENSGAISLSELDIVVLTEWELFLVSGSDIAKLLVNVLL